MNRIWILPLAFLILAAIALTACETEAPAVQSPVPTDSSTGQPLAPKTVVSTSAAPKATAPAATSLPKGALTCPPNAPLPASAPLAARVNGVGIALDAYNRQQAQAQAAMTQNGGLDLKSSAGQETLKSLKQQVLDQMINDVVIQIQSDREGIKVTDDDLNARLAQMIQDAGSVDKLNEYLSKNQLTLADLCSQVRNQLLGEAMLNRVTAALPATAEQVHARHILVASAQQAQAILDQLHQGKDFAALAKQYSLDEASKANGGDLGWFPKDVMDPRFEAVAFQLKVNEISQVVQTQFGFHIIQVLEHESNRALPPEVIQNKRQQAFLAWLQAVRETMKIDRLVQP
ncbi:MAG: peptidylprolyl isomerase [Chloroflexota bacterium]|nr:peptidylprolyl isomerase [Chloroflexota bacterium]